MADKTLGPWPLGIDNRSDAEAIPAGALSAALNVLVDTDGTISSAKAPRLAMAGAGIHSLWADSAGVGYCVSGENLCRVSGETLIPIAALSGPDRVSYCELNGSLLVGSRLQLSRLSGDSLEPLSIPAPAIRVVAVDRGGLNAGRYGVAASHRLNGVESGVGFTAFVDVAQGGGISVDIPDSSADSVSIYRTDANGGSLYRAVDAPVGIDGFLVGAGALGAMPGTHHLEPMLGGSIMHAWQGRLLVAQGRTLRYSAPMRYGLHNPSTDFIDFPSAICMVLPVNDGVYAADSKKCYWLAGTDPDAWRMQVIDSDPPAAGASMLIDGSQFTDIPPVPIACWLSSTGFALGLPEGQVVKAQEKRIRIQKPVQSWLAFDGRRLFSGG